MNFSDRPIIITDVETTGLNPDRHEIIDIGAIRVDHNLRELSRFSVYVQPLNLHTAEAEAFAINGYDPKNGRIMFSPHEAAVLFSDFALDGILCAWNITFEWSFLRALLGQSQLERLDYHRIDIPSIFWFLHGGQLDKLSMDVAAESLGLPPEPVPHTGITGAEYELKILRLLKSRLEIIS